MFALQTMKPKRLSHFSNGKTNRPRGSSLGLVKDFRTLEGLSQSLTGETKRPKGPPHGKVEEKKKPGPVPRHIREDREVQKLISRPDEKDQETYRRIPKLE